MPKTLLVIPLSTPQVFTEMFWALAVKKGIVPDDFIIVTTKKQYNLIVRRLTEPQIPLKNEKGELVNKTPLHALCHDPSFKSVLERLDKTDGLKRLFGLNDENGEIDFEFKKKVLVAGELDIDEDSRGNYLKRHYRTDGKFSKEDIRERTDLLNDVCDEEDIDIFTKFLYTVVTERIKSYQAQGHNDIQVIYSQSGARDAMLDACSMLQKVINRPQDILVKIHPIPATIVNFPDFFFPITPVEIEGNKESEGDKDKESEANKNKKSEDNKLYVYDELCLVAIPRDEIDSLKKLNAILYNEHFKPVDKRLAEQNYPESEGLDNDSFLTYIDEEFKGLDGDIKAKYRHCVNYTEDSGEYDQGCDISIQEIPAALLHPGVDIYKPEWKMTALDALKYQNSSHLLEKGIYQHKVDISHNTRHKTVIDLSYLYNGHSKPLLNVTLAGASERDGGTAKNQCIEWYWLGALRFYWLTGNPLHSKLPPVTNNDGKKHWSDGIEEEIKKGFKKDVLNNYLSMSSLKYKLCLLWQIAYQQLILPNINEDKKVAVILNLLPRETQAKNPSNSDIQNFYSPLISEVEGKIKWNNESPQVIEFTNFTVLADFISNQFKSLKEKQNKPPLEDETWQLMYDFLVMLTAPIFKWTEFKTELENDYKHIYKRPLSYVKQLSNSKPKPSFYTAGNNAAYFNWQYASLVPDIRYLYNLLEFETPKSIDDLKWKTVRDLIKHFDSIHKPDFQQSGWLKDIKKDYINIQLSALLGGPLASCILNHGNDYRFFMPSLAKTEEQIEHTILYAKDAITLADVVTLN